MGNGSPATTKRSSRRRLSPPPIEAESGAGPAAPISSRAGSAAACASGSWRSTRTAKAASSTAATTGARAASQPRRTNVGLHRAAVLGLQLIGDDVELQAAIRRELDRALTPALKAGGGARTRRSRHGVDDLVAQRRKLLRLYYDDKVGADLFAEEEARLSVAIREAQRESDDALVEVARADDVTQHFDAVAQLLATLDVDRTWKVATDIERRVLIDEFIEEITVLPDYLDVKVHGAPAVHVLYQEVGLKESGFDRVGGSTDNFVPRPIFVESGWSELRKSA